MGLRLQRAALPELLARPAHRRHAKPQKFRDLSSALVPFIELQNAATHGKRFGSHKHTLSHIFLFVKLHYLWKCSSQHSHGAGERRTRVDEIVRRTAEEMRHRTNESRERPRVEPGIARCLGSSVAGNRIVERAHRGIRWSDRANRQGSSSRSGPAE